MGAIPCGCNSTSTKDTITYLFFDIFRSDSTIVAPYERWQYYNENVKSLNENINYAENKTKQVGIMNLSTSISH